MHSTVCGVAPSVHFVRQITSVSEKLHRHLMYTIQKDTGEQWHASSDKPLHLVCTSHPANVFVIRCQTKYLPIICVYFKMNSLCFTAISSLLLPANCKCTDTNLHTSYLAENCCFVTDALPKRLRLAETRTPLISLT